MTRAYLALMLTADHLKAEARAHWLRLLVGAVSGWVLATFLGAFALALVDVEDGLLVALSSAIVWGGIFVGMWVSWRGRA